MNSVEKNNDGHTSLKPRPERDYGITLLRYHLSADAEVIKKMHQSVSVDKNKEAK
jgi:hypothetical protein